MKTKQLVKYQSLALVTGLALCTALLAIAGAAHGQIYVANYATGGNGTGTVGEYDATTGATINASLVSGLNGPTGVAVSGGHLYVTNFGTGTIGEYDAATGATINASLITGLNGPHGIVVSGGNLWVSNYYAGTIGEYDATTGATINAALVSVSGINLPLRMAVSGGNLWVVINANYYLGGTNSVIGEYDATTGATINAALISLGFDDPIGIALSGGNLFVDSTYNNGTIGEYDATTGATINVSLVSGFGLAYDMALSSGHLYVPSYSNGTISEYDATTGATINASLVSGLNHPYGIAVITPYTAQVQQPINPGGSSVFNVRRGVVPVKFTLTQGGVATCDLPPATIAVTRTAGGTPGSVNESVYTMSADSGSNFRIDSCQYIYNLNSAALGVGTYRVDIKINNQVVGSATFQLK